MDYILLKGDYLMRWSPFFKQLTEKYIYQSFLEIYVYKVKLHSGGVFTPSEC